MGNWNETKKLLSNYTGRSERIFDILSDFEILESVAHGVSNQGIIRAKNNITADDIRKACEKYYAFPGWECDIEIDPYIIYIKNQMFLAYAAYCWSNTEMIDAHIRTSYHVAQVFDAILGELENAKC